MKLKNFTVWVYERGMHTEVYSYATQDVSAERAAEQAATDYYSMTAYPLDHITVVDDETLKATRWFAAAEDRRPTQQNLTRLAHLAKQQGFRRTSLF